MSDQVLSIVLHDVCRSLRPWCPLDLCSVVAAMFESSESCIAHSGIAESQFRRQKDRFHPRLPVAVLRRSLPYSVLLAALYGAGPCETRHLFGEARHIGITAASNSRH